MWTEPQAALPQDGSLGRAIMACQLFPHLRFTFAPFDVRGKDSVPYRVRRSQHCLDASVGWREVSYRSSNGEKLSFCCTTFVGPPHIQEGANHCLPQ